MAGLPAPLNALAGLAPADMLAPENMLSSDNAPTDAPTLMGGWAARAAAYKPWADAQRASGVAAGLLDPETGWPTSAALVDAAHQYGNALLAGTAAPAHILGNSAEIGAFSRIVGYTPPVKGPRPLTADYPNGVPVDATGRITADIEGRPLTAQNIAGRRAVDDQGAAPDWGLDQKAIESVGKGAGGAAFLGVPQAQLPKKAVGSFTPRWDPATGDRASEIRTLNTLTPAKEGIVEAHEVGHLIDWVANGIPTTGLSTELKRLYNTLNTGQERTTHLTGPTGYSAKEVPREMMAEAIRAYMQNPNYIKSVAPETAKAIRERVNSHPQLNKWIQFNSAAGLAAGGAAAASQSDTDDH